MSGFPLPGNESERLRVVNSFRLLDTPAEEDLDQLTRLASIICKTPIALISVLDKDRQWFKSNVGVPAAETERAISFCAHAIVDTSNMMEVSNAHNDLRFADNPIVKGDMNVTFYAGVPLRTDDGHALGTLCVLDHEQRHLNNEQREALQIIASQVMSKLIARKHKLELEETISLIQKQTSLSVPELSPTVIKNNSVPEVTRNTLLALTSKMMDNVSMMRSLVESSHYALLILKGDSWVIEFINSMMLEIWEKKFEDVIGQPLMKILPELIDQPFPNFINNVYKTGKSFAQKEEAFFSKTPSGITNKFVSFYYDPLINTDDEVTGIIVTASDITEQVNSRHLLEESEERFRTMAENSGILITVSDENGHATYFSKAWVDLTGRSVNELLDLVWVDMIHPDDRDRYVRILYDAFENRVPFTTEYRIRNKEGDYRWLLTTGPPRFNSDGSFAGYISSCVDITEQKEDEQRKNDFIGMVSHEMKTPLTSLSAYIQLLKVRADSTGDEFGSNALQKTIAQVNKLTSLINGFLSTAHLSTGKIMLKRSVFDLQLLTKEVADDSSGPAPTHNIVIETSESVVINADRDKIGNVISNLISNAMKYSAIGSTITLSCVMNKKMAVIAVEDNGVGISQKEQERLFERFYRVNNMESKKISGFGIGLYLCSEIIDRHEGNIGVESTVGKGSTFYFELPLN